MDLFAQLEELEVQKYLQEFSILAIRW